MNVGSLFSGVGGMDAGLARAGHRPVFFCEADEWRREVLAARWPEAYDMSEFSRWDSRVDRNAGDCWLWTGSLTTEGYGRFEVGKRDVGAHRFSYEHYVAAIPHGYQIDHLCRVRHCVNPAHLEAVTQRENILRGDGPTAQNARKTHCTKGHPFNEENTYVHPSGQRVCRTCQRESNNRSYAHRKSIPIYDDVRGVHASPDVAEGRDSGGGVRGEASGGRAPRPDGEQGTVDLLCGGFPCQDLSVAGKRAGLDGDRSGLFFEFARVIDAFRPRWILLENVLGLLSSQGGRDFGTVVGTLADVGYGVAWRVLDSRFFGVPQRRRRVFIVGARADGDFAAAAGRAGEVLAVGSRCSGHPPTGSQAGEAASVASLSGLGSGGPDDNDGQANRVIAVTHSLTSEGHDASEDGTGRGTPLVAAPLTKGSASGDGVNPPGRRQEDDVNIVPVTAFYDTDGSQAGFWGSNEVSPTLKVGSGVGASSGMGVAIPATGVRRLTPVECERLQGLPDNWTRLNAKTPDSRRYSAMGDAVTANVAEWIGLRLEATT